MTTNENEDIDEKWMEIPDFPGYQASTAGRIKSPKKVLNPYKNPGGYMTVSLHKEDKQYNRRVHRLVLSTFKPNDDATLSACHIDGNSVNNLLVNLKWGNQKENYADARRHGTAPMAERHGLAKLDKVKVAEIRRALKNKESQRSIAKRYGVHQTSVGHINQGEIWTTV